MRKQKQNRLRAKGWQVGTVKEFLGLSDEESAYIELKIKLAAGLRQRVDRKNGYRNWISRRNFSRANRVSPRWKRVTLRFPWTY
jgi:hypothetical protein